MSHPTKFISAACEQSRFVFGSNPEAPKKLPLGVAIHRSSTRRGPPQTLDDTAHGMNDDEEEHEKMPMPVVSTKAWI